MGNARQHPVRYTWAPDRELGNISQAVHIFLPILSIELSYYHRASMETKKNLSEPRVDYLTHSLRLRKYFLLHRLFCWKSSFTIQVCLALTCHMKIETRVLKPSRHSTTT